MKISLCLLAFLVGGLSACNSGPHSPAGFRLPENGDVERGKAAFVELECYSCHTVAGVDDLPPPSAEPPVPVVLGGQVHEIRTDGYLVTSIIHPSHRVGRYRRSEVTVEGESRMPDFTHEMTVRQLVDVVAFLQSRYKVILPPHGGF